MTASSPARPGPALRGRLPAVRASLCGADDDLSPSETPASEASVDVTNRFLAAHGIARPVTAEQLRADFTGEDVGTTPPGWPPHTEHR
ncbi:MAG: haloacid dehalogenase [Modestobacter sp.]|jgi:hypothetical protein|nr:haloacid dehalogenase [Modestobacter sp.]